MVAARQEINAGVAGMEVQGGFDARTYPENEMPGETVQETGL